MSQTVMTGKWSWRKEFSSKVQFLPIVWREIQIYWQALWKLQRLAK